MKNLKSYRALSEGYPYIKSSYREIINIIQLQLDLIANGLQYSQHSENELNAKIKYHVDLCISNFNLIKDKKKVIPIEHNLLRFYRDNMHHNDMSASFKPWRCPDGMKFYIWPVLNNLKSVKNRYPLWSKSPNLVTLEELLYKNLKYMDGLFKEVSQSFADKDIVYFKEYPYPQFSVGKKCLSNESSWTLSE